MSTHEGVCCVCGKATYCCDDSSMLSLSDSCDGDTYPKLEVCSVPCFSAIKEKWNERLAFAKRWLKDESPRVHKEMQQAGLL